MTGDVRLALTTGPDRSTLRAIARTLVGERLIACANVIDGATSIYRWEGAIHEEEECLALLKTTADRVPSLTERLRELHPNDLPELIVLDVETGLEPYLDWVREGTRVG